MRDTPTKTPLRGCRVLVIEDEDDVAEAVASALDQAGATVLGPAATVAEALSLLAPGRMPDLAVLDLNLRGEMSLPVADRLAALGVPFVVTTGYGAIGDLAGHSSVVVLAKPYAMADLAAELLRLRGSPQGSGAKARTTGQACARTVTDL